MSGTVLLSTDGGFGVVADVRFSAAPPHRVQTWLTRYVAWLTTQEGYAPDSMDGWVSPAWFRIHIPESQFVPDFCQRLQKMGSVSIVYSDPIEN
jgi:hypothetical protein